MNNHLEVLKKARELISDRRHWTQGAMARDTAGGGVFARDPSACRWCAAGALLASGETTSISHLLEDEILTLGVTPQTLSMYNDNHTHTEVLALFDRTIERLENNPQ